MSLQYEPPALPPRGEEPVPKGMVDDGVTVTLRERPLVLWVMAAVFGVIGVAFLSGPGSSALVGLLFAGTGMALGGTTGVLVVTADRRTRVLTIERRALLRSFRTQVPFAEVRGIVVRTSRSTSSSGERPTATYRTVVVRLDGQEVPLRTYFESGGLSRRRERARALAAAVGLVDPPEDEGRSRLWLEDGPGTPGVPGAAFDE